MSSPAPAASGPAQRNTLFLDLTRSVGPVSAGTVVERYQLRAEGRS